MMRTGRLVALALLGACVFFGPAAGPSVAGEPSMGEAEKLLRRSSYQKRLAGLELLSQLGHSDRAERFLLKALLDEDWEVQMRAIGILGAFAQDSSRKALVRMAYLGEIQAVRDLAIKTLKGLDRERAASRLLQLARKERDSMKKSRALFAAGHLVSSSHLKKLRPFVRDKDVRAQAAAVGALLKMAADESVRKDVFKALRDVLKKRAEKKFFLAYAAAIEGLGTIDTEAVRRLLIDELLLQPDDDGYIPERIARALSAFEAEPVAVAIRAGFERAKAPVALRRLLRLITRLEAKALGAKAAEYLSHKDERVRSEATRAVGRLRHEAAKEPLQDLLEDGSYYVQVEAVTALARVLPQTAFLALGPRIAGLKGFGPRLQFVVEVQDFEGEQDAGVQALVAFLEDGSWRVASAAAASIGTLGMARHLPLLTPLAKRKDWRIRAAAFEGFGRLRALKAIDLLIGGLKDKDPVVRGVCHANLQILLRKKFPPDFGLWDEWWRGSKKGVEIVKRSRRSDAQKKADAELAARNARYGKTEREKEKEKDRGIEILQKARILVITGAWDHVEIVLDHLNIRHTLLRAQEIKDAGVNPNQIILINCEGNVDKRVRERLRWFVNVGGYLMTTDWALTKAVRVCFPGYMQQYAKSSTGNDVVVVEEAAPGNVLTRGVFDDVPALKWWLEVQAFPITINYPERCHVLVDSAEMRQRYGSSPMGAVFRWGLGKVQHSVSHFYLQEEGMQSVSKPRERMVFSRDHLGLSLAQIRKLKKRGAFEGSVTEAAMREIAPDYSMFRLIVNFVAEKAAWVENL